MGGTNSVIEVHLVFSVVQVKLNAVQGNDLFSVQLSASVCRVVVSVDTVDTKSFQQKRPDQIRCVVYVYVCNEIFSTEKMSNIDKFL